MAVKSSDPIVKAVRRLVDRAVAWQRRMSDERCTGCGIRVHRTEEEVLLSSAITEYTTLLARRVNVGGGFEAEEAPTRKRHVNRAVPVARASARPRVR